MHKNTAVEVEGMLFLKRVASALENRLKEINRFLADAPE